MIRKTGFHFSGSCSKHRRALPGDTAGKATYPVSQQKKKQGSFSLISRRRTRRLPSLRKDGPGQVVHLPFPPKSPAPDHKIEHDLK
jgi:hypothetical protein